MRAPADRNFTAMTSVKPVFAAYPLTPNQLKCQTSSINWVFADSKSGDNCSTILVSYAARATGCTMCIEESTDGRSVRSENYRNRGHENNAPFLLWLVKDNLVQRCFFLRCAGD